MRHIDLKNHPFERKFNEMIKSAREYAKFKKAQPAQKTVPSHIIPKWNNEFDGWGMFNNRLNMWVGTYYDDYVQDHIQPTFQSPEDAIAWYKTLI